MGRGSGFRLRNIVFLLKEGHQLLRQYFLVGKGDEGVHKTDVFLLDLLHVVFNILRVGSDDGAVEMIARLRRLVPLVGNAGVEDGLNILGDEPGDVAVDQLGRIALRFAGNGLNAQLIELFRGLGRQHSAEAQLLEEGGPERIILVHVQHSGNADGASGGFVRRPRLIVEHPVVFVVKQVGNVPGDLFLSQTSLTAVAADKVAAAAELVDGEHAVVGTAPASGDGGGVL